MNRMNRLVITIICFFIFISGVTEAQKVTYSEIQSKDKSSMSFNIIGKVRDNYLIYKNPSGKHIISVYAPNMMLIDQLELDDIPERLINMDCIRYANGAFLIFQHQKGSVVYCKALKIDANGKKMNDIILLDTAQIGYFTENTIYSAVHSEDRSKICVYRRKWKNDVFKLQAKITDTSLKVIDSFSFSKLENERKSNFSELSIDNKGNIIFAGEQREHQGDNVSELRLFHRVPQSKQMKMMDLDLQGNFLLGAVLKVDNRNNNYLINFHVGNYFEPSMLSFENGKLKIVHGELNYQPTFSKLLKITSVEQYGSMVDNVTPTAEQWPSLRQELFTGEALNYLKEVE
jgi:hypothetical protein